MHTISLLYLIFFCFKVQTFKIFEYLIILVFSHGCFFFFNCRKCEGRHYVSKERKEDDYQRKESVKDDTSVDQSLIGLITKPGGTSG